MSLNVLISSAGRRVGLILAFRESLRALDLQGKILAVDATPLSSAAHFADCFSVVPRCTSADFVGEVLRLCQREQVSLIVPTIDTELPIYAEALPRFRAAGVQVGISDPRTISLCFDKQLTHRWLTDHGFPVPRQSTLQEILRRPSTWQMPVILKPRNGSASVGVRVVERFEELPLEVSAMGSLVVQEVIRGDEFTVNMYVDRKGRCLSAVPHRRLETRGGEVTKGTTVRNTKLIDLARQLAELLPGAFGAMNVQCFVCPDGDLRIIEINARFGGGYPLAHRAGSPMTKWLLEEVLHREPQGPFDTWEDGLTMLRYDEAVFIKASR